MKQLKVTQRAVILTVNGKPAAVVQDAAAYQRLLDIAASADATEGIRQGLSKRTKVLGRPAVEFFDEMRKKYAIPG